MTDGYQATTTYSPGYILKCNECYNQFRVESVGGWLLVSLPKFCPYCGIEAVECSINQDLDYWFALAESFGLKNTMEDVTLLKEMYELWPTETYKRFRDFVEEVMKGS